MAIFFPEIGNNIKFKYSCDYDTLYNVIHILKYSKIT